MTAPVEDGPDTIWLEPSCCADPSHGRQWCEDDAFPVCEDGKSPVKYIRADLAATQHFGATVMTIPSPDRVNVGLAYLSGPQHDGTYKWCKFPCQRMPGRTCRVPVKPHVVPGVGSWDVTGPPDAPTLSPSINCDNDRCWHGRIVNGEMR